MFTIQVLRPKSKRLRGSFAVYFWVRLLISWHIHIGVKKKKAADFNVCFFPPRQQTTFITLGVIALIFASFSVFVLTVLYRRGIAIRRKRAMRRYMESGEVGVSLKLRRRYCAMCRLLMKPLLDHRVSSLWSRERREPKSSFGSWNPPSCVSWNCWVTEYLGQYIRYFILLQLAIQGWCVPGRSFTTPSSTL